MKTRYSEPGFVSYYGRVHEKDLETCRLHRQEDSFG